MESKIPAANDQLLNDGSVEMVPEFFADNYVLHGSEGGRQRITGRFTSGMGTDQRRTMDAERIREISGEEDVEWLDVLPDTVPYLEEELRPQSIVRVGGFYFMETVQYPGEWWMGSMVDGSFIVWGSYGPLEEAIRSR